MLRHTGEILAHIGDLLDWALVMARKKHEWHDSEPLAWDKEVQRFFAALEALDEYLASGNPLRSEPEKLFQGPIADALTHIGRSRCFAAWREHRFAERTICAPRS